MKTTAKWDTIQPRFLRYRGHYKIYLSFALMFCGLLSCYWGYRFFHYPGAKIWVEQEMEIFLTSVYFVGLSSYYFLWMRARLSRSVQVYPDHIMIHDGPKSADVKFEDVESVTVVGWSLFYFKMKDGHKHYFSSGLERVDYIWEGINAARPGLLAVEEFESFRQKLVQHDHHQKRKEWFFKHKVVDVFNWFILPFAFLLGAYFFQSRSIAIHQEGLYFFRLFMYSLLVLLVTNFFFSIVLKKFVFDKKFVQMTEAGVDKFRDIEFEGVVLQRSKMVQLGITCFLFAIIVKTDLNFYSLTKIKEDLSYFELTKGKTIVVDNRYNCTQCQYMVHDGDLIVFGKGSIGQVMAQEGEMVGEVSKDARGRSIASSNIHEVPAGHIAVKSSNGKDLIFVRVSDLVGKIQK